jgi:hypothetical protein
MNLFVVLTIGFDLLYAFFIVRLDRRDLSMHAGAHNMFNIQRDLI